MPTITTQKGTRRKVDGRTKEGKRAIARSPEGKAAKEQQAKDAEQAILDNTTVTVRQLDMEIARKSFSHWLDYCHIEAPPGMSADNTGQNVIKYEKWPYLTELIIPAFENQRLIDWLKARQVSASWTTAAWLLWFASYHTNAHVGEFSQNEEDAKELIRKQKFIYRHLPPELQVPVRSLDNQLEIVFNKTNSWIRAFPSTQSAGRGYTFSKVWFDEFDFHEYATDAYYAVKPALDDVGGQVILTSTSDFRKMDTEFKTIWMNSPGNGFHRIFVGWDARPDRDNQWYDEKRKEYADPERFVKENPSTPEEALAPPATMTFFDHNVLNEMQEDCREPIQQVGSVSYYQKFSPGKRYVAASDTSHGVGLDNSVTVVLDVDTGAVVADICSPFLSNDDFAMDSINLLGEYDNPMWAIEDNDWGSNVIRKAQAMSYPHLYSSELKSARGARKSLGFHTGGSTSGTRFDVWGELQSGVNARQITIFNQEGLSQFFQVIRNPDRYGRAEARSGGHDDYPMAVGIAWLIRHRAMRASRIRSRMTEERYISRDGEGRKYGRRRKAVARW